MGKAQPLKDLGKFAESLVRDTVGNMTGLNQHDRQGREMLASKNKERRTASYQRYAPSAIESFARMGSALTSKTESDLEAAKPKSYAVSEYLGKGNRTSLTKEGVEASWATKTEEEHSKIQGLYNKSMTRLGEVKRARQRPGARKQSLITRKY